MISRHARCVDCDAEVLLTNARPVVRTSGIGLQCLACAGPPPFEEDDDAYDAIVVSGDSGDLPDESTSGPEGSYGARHGSVSGAIEAKRTETRQDATPPAVIINHDAES